jgi:hypothetical protein
MVENEKIIKENIKLPDNILSESETIKVEEPNNEIELENNNQEVKIKQEEIKPKKNILNKVSEAIFTSAAAAEPDKVEIKKVEDFNEEQTKDFNKLLELNVKPEKAKKIILGESVEIKKLDTEGKSEYEVDKEILANKGRDLDLIIKSKPEVASISEEIFVDSAGIETKGGTISTKLLYELNGYNADKENEIKGSIRFDLGFGLDGAQFKENNIKNLLIKRISESGEYDKETLDKYLDQIEVKTVPLTYKGSKKKGLVYRIPKELGGTNMFAAVDSPKISSDDLRDAAADSAPIVASIIGGTFGSALGPVGTVAGSAVSAGFTEYARLMYGYHKLGLQKDLYTPEAFNKVALSMSIKYAAIDATATGVFLAGAKMILPTILGKSQLSTSTIKEFIESEGKTNTGIFKEVNKVKDQMKKEFNFTQTEVDNYFAVSVGKAILNSDQLVKKGSAAQRALLSDEVTKLEAKAEFKAIEDKIIKQTTRVSEIGNKKADKVIANIQRQIVGQAEVGIKQAELTLLKNSRGLVKLEQTFVDDAATKYLDEFGVTLDDTYKALEARISLLNKNIENGVIKNTTPIKFNVSNAIKILENDLKRFTFKKGLFPTKLQNITKKTTAENAKKIRAENKLFRLYSIFNDAGFQTTGKKLKSVKEGFQQLQKKKDLNLRDVVTLKNAVNLLLETTENATSIGALKQLSKNINQNISKAIKESGDTVLGKEFAEQLELLNLKRATFFKNFADDFGSSAAGKEGMENLKYNNEKLFNRIINDSDAARKEAFAFGDLIKKNLVPDATVQRIKQALYRNYFNKVIPGVDNVAEMTHTEFFKKFGKNYESLLGSKEYSKIVRSSDEVFKSIDNSFKAVNDINASVAKFLPGIENWSALSNSGPGEIVEFILSPAFTKTANLTKLLNALPVQTVKEIRELFLTRMMKDVTGEGFVPNKAAQMIAGTPMRTGTINGASMNAYLNTNRSALLQLYSSEFFTTMRSVANVLEMLQVPTKLAKAADISARKATENAALFIDMIYGPLNHKRLILNRASRLFDKFGLSQDNLMLFNDYGTFVEAAQKNFLAGNYPRWMTKLPQKERGVFIDKAMRLINKTINIANLGLNRGAGLRKTFTANPVRNPLVIKEYLEDKVEGDDDRMKDDADIFFPVDVAAKYAIKSLMAVFGKTKELTYDKVKESFKDVKEVEERNLEKEKFEEKIN